MTVLSGAPWRAAHEGPERFLARSEHADWWCAQEWLEAVALGFGVFTALAAIAHAQPYCEFLGEFSGHSFALCPSYAVEFSEVLVHA